MAASTTAKYQVWFRTFVLEPGGKPVMLDGAPMVDKEIDKGVVTLVLKGKALLEPENAIMDKVGKPPSGYSLNYQIVD